jgi:hypothetical protein
MKAVIGCVALNPIEKHMGELFTHTHILSEDLKLLVVHVCDTTRVPFEDTYPFRRSTKKEILDWIRENWPTPGQVITTIAVNQQKVGHQLRLGDQKVRK